MVPFPQGFEIPKFDKYCGTRNPKDHIREFHVHYMEVAYDDSYLMWLFPQSLARPTMEWFSHLHLGIKKFQEIVDLIIQNYSFNTGMDVSLEELSALKQSLRGKHLRPSCNDGDPRPIGASGPCQKNSRFALSSPVSKEPFPSI